MRIRVTRFTLFIAISICGIMLSCSKSDERETPSGFKVTYVKKGDGNLVKPGEILIIDMAIVDANDSVWYDNRVSDYPEMVKIADESKKETETGINEAFRMLSEGDSILFSMRAKDFFPTVWKTTPPAGMDEETLFTFQISCREVLDEAGAMKFQVERDSIHRIREEERYAERERQMAEYLKEQIGQDTVIIDDYLKVKGIKASALPSGLRYVLKSKGAGETIEEGDLINVKYAGQTLDGREFDSGEYAFTVGKREVIEGWDLIAQTMKKGTSLTVFIPSTMGYGRGGRPPVIMPDAILIFDMEILSVKKSD
jgi:FKBP-type peptidyl-prolyl cis-trans isomerase FkpA